jgi:hypothetical protein
MNKKQNAREDILKRYVNREMMEQAPEGFTSRVMSVVQLEPLPVKARNKHESLRIIPIISAIITMALIGLAFLTGGKTETLQFPVPEIIKGINFSLPDLNLIFSINLPSTLIYVLGGLVALTLFDEVLKAVFRREN